MSHVSDYSRSNPIGITLVLRRSLGLNENLHFVSQKREFNHSWVTWSSDYSKNVRLLAIQQALIQNGARFIFEEPECYLWSLNGFFVLNWLSFSLKVFYCFRAVSKASNLGPLGSNCCCCWAMIMNLLMPSRDDQ